MKKFILCSILTGLTALLAPAAAQDDEFKGYRRYQVESGIIEYKVAGAQVGTETLYFDRWGLREAKYTTANMMGMPRKTLTILDGKWSYNIDLTAKLGSKMETPALRQIIEQAGGSKDLFTASEEMMKGAGGKKTGTEKIAGKLCDVWEIEQMNTKLWLWKFVALKTEIKFGEMELLSEAVSVKEGVPIAKEKFAVPSGIEIKEGPAPPKTTPKR